MATDFWLFQQKDLIDPVFRHYGWNKNEITFGYGQNWNWVKKQNQVKGLQITRRPTGGGIVQHGRDWTYTLILPHKHASSRVPALDFYEAIHLSIGNALLAQKFHTTLMPCPVQKEKQKGIPGDCFLEPVGKDLMNKSGSKKIAGAAMKRTKKGILIQGTIDISMFSKLDLDKFYKFFVKEIENLLFEKTQIERWPIEFDHEHKFYVKQFAASAWLENRKLI
jgi:lipoate-protein ligase A